MTDRIGSFRNIVPVISAPNVPPRKEPVATPEPPGVKWSKTSTFKYSLPLYDVSPHASSNKGAVVKDSPKIEYEVRVESLAQAVKYMTSDYDISERVIDPDHSVHDSTQLGETWTDAWVLLGTESLQKISGYTINRDGTVTERYRTVEVTRYLHFGFTKRGPTPNVRNVTHNYGEIPPP